jgi:hypothetical protein
LPAARPLSAADKALIREAAKRQSEEVAKKQMGVQRWVRVKNVTERDTKSHFTKRTQFPPPPYHKRNFN